LATETAPRQAAERVLSTLNPDGSRRWLRPRPSPGRFLRTRRAVAYALIFLFVLIPYVKIGGKPVILLDIERRQFTLFGTTFLPTDMLLFMLLFVGAFFFIFFLTALLGRVWCGWGCPQTVYMEFLFRPVERLVEGGWRGSQRLDARGLWASRRMVKHVVYLVLALILAHIFLAYFVPVGELLTWMRRSPVEHPTSFLVMACTTALIFFDFAYFREQTCLVACPYGRLQSVLLDRRSLIVGYDRARGEPRRKGLVGRPAEAGDCVDCKLCVQTCPTGIDIRDGLQMECIHCTQCMDACDTVMVRVGKPPGLIRYGSQDGFEGRASRRLRPRVVLYPAALAVSLGLFVWVVGTRGDTDVTLLRGIGAPYTLAPDGRVLNQVRIKVANRAGAEQSYRIELLGAPGATLIAPQNPLPVPAGKSATTSVFVMAPADAFHEGVREVAFRLTGSAGRFAEASPYRLVGPEEEEEGEP
jgi:cytochrome c oxidase accessory protein FixG